MTKICNRCGCKVDDNVNFCPDCRSQSFKGEVVKATANSIVVNTKPQGKVVHDLFYQKTEYGYVLSKAKLSSISVFLFFTASIFAGFPAFGALVVGFLLAAMIYLLMRAISNSFEIAKPTKVVVEHNDYGFVTDLKHLLFYWQNKKTGGYVLSKTKLCSHIIFLLAFIFFSFIPYTNFIGWIMASLVFEIPAFAIGTVIHKLTNPYPEALVLEKRVIDKPKILKTDTSRITGRIRNNLTSGDPEIKNLRKEFDIKESNVRDVIEKRFQPPQLTYTRFIGIVDKSKELFDKEYDALVNLVELGDADSPKISAEIESRKDTLRSIIKKIDDLTNELVLTMDNTDKFEVDDVISHMENLIKSVKDYEQ
ncbi:zinc ribbon domain-containing protein [Methanobrevibacter sp.]|uniref:zinc ribbon domain-containing protein n=1 Tax=Methanobrevibacter sp. TaxID=66852 RepID=UPI00388E1414